MAGSLDHSTLEDVRTSCLFRHDIDLGECSPVKSIFKIFFGAPDSNPYLVLFCLVLSGLVGAIGLMTFLPVITELSGGMSAGSSPLNIQVVKFIAMIGLTPSTGTLLILAVSAIILKAVLSFAALSYVGHVAATLSANLRLQLLSHIMDAKWGYFTDQPAGRITDAISSQAMRAGKAYMVSGMFFAIGLETVIYVFLAIIVSWQLALIGLVGGGTIALFLSFLIKISRRAGRKQTNRTSEIVTSLTDTLGNIKPLKAMSQQKLFMRTLQKNVIKLRNSVRTQAFSRQGLKYGKEVFIALFAAGGIYIASVLWQTPLPELILSGVIFIKMLQLVTRAQHYLQSSVQSESAYWAVQNMIRQARKNREKNTGTKTPTLDHSCRYDQVSFAHRDKKILKSVNLEFPANAITVLYGPSGAGKTTIADLLIGLFQPDKGQILIDDVPLTEIDIDKWRHMIGYVPQEPTLFHDTIRVNVTLGDPSLSDEDVWDALKQAGSTDFIDAMPEGLDSTVGERGAKISGGQKQRIALARALVTKPKLLILDEVTSALDEVTEAKICANIQKISNHGYTVLAITHRSAWTKIADRLYKIEAKEITMFENGDAVAINA